MQLTRVAPITLAQNDSQVSEPCHHAIASEPSTPHAAHSVAVAQPISSETNTNTISSITGMRLQQLVQLLAKRHRRIGRRRAMRMQRATSTTM